MVFGDDLIDCSIYFATLLILILFNIFLKNRQKWKKIGTLEGIYIYEVEGGCAQEVKVAMAANSERNNLRKLGFRPDRKFVIYSQRENDRSNRVILLKQEFYDLAKRSFFKNANLVINKAESLCIYYADEACTLVYDCGEEIAKMLTEAYGGGKVKYRLGYQQPKVDDVRQKFRCLQTDQDLNGLNRQHSVCTLVNQQSIDDIRNMINEGNVSNQYLDALRFQPNLVINASKYCEDKIKALKIGSAEFNSPLPCPINTYVNLDPNTLTMSANNEPFSTLEKTRQLKNVNPKISKHSCLPVFGIQLLVSRTGLFKVNDAVYAKF